MKNSDTLLDESPSAPAPKLAPRLTARRVNLALALLVGCLLLGFGFQHSRKIRFLVTRDVRVDGLTLSLDPLDKMVTLHILDHGNYEPAETRVVRDLLKPGDTFIDVGANIGWYTLIGSRIVGEQGRVIAFEPAPASFGLLSRNARINGCRNTILVDDALSNKAGKIRLNLGDTNKGHNSFLKTSETKESVEVDAVTLDAYLKGDKREIALIKIDVEGAEGFVLEGMKETLRNQPRMALLMEFFPTLIRQAGFDPAAMLREFLGSGYEIHDIEETPGQLTPIHEAGIPALVERLENGGAHINVLIKRPS